MTYVGGGRMSPFPIWSRGPIPPPLGSPLRTHARTRCRTRRRSIKAHGLFRFSSALPNAPAVFRRLQSS